MKRTDSEARLQLLKNSLGQVKASLFEISPTATYVRHLLMQEQAELRMEIAELGEYRRVRGWS
jgi:hypothetical protein